ncbi:MAG: hypothetical protein DMG30_13805 [Acidobacteria bacterium]|nr:MAG: hypothetical protein DMG30_13805 [Acidobacteriota bacterium]
MKLRGPLKKGPNHSRRSANLKPGHWRTVDGGSLRVGELKAGMSPICISIIGPESRQGWKLFRLLSCLFRRALRRRDSVTGISQRASDILRA